MKASEFIVHLQQMIKEHGDLPLALMENKDVEWYGTHYIEISGVESVVKMDSDNLLWDEDDKVSRESKLFLID